MQSLQGSTIIPCLRYRQAPRMIDWLCDAFGFQRHAVYADGDTVHHAQLTFGSGMIMLGSVDNGGEWGKLIVQPEDIDLRETQSACVIVSDPDAHYARQGVRRHHRAGYRRPGPWWSRLFVSRS